MILDSSYHGIYHIILPLKCCQSSTKRSSWRTGLGLFISNWYLYKIRLQGFTSVNCCCLYLFFIYLFIGASATPWWEELKREERKWCATVKWEKSVTSLCANHSDWCGGVRFKQITYLHPLIYFLMMNGSRRGMESYT